MQETHKTRRFKALPNFWLARNLELFLEDWFFTLVDNTHRENYSLGCRVPPVEGVWGRPVLTVNLLPLPLTPQATSRIWNSHQELEKDPNFLGRMLNHERLLVPRKTAWPSFGAGSLNCHLGELPSPHIVSASGLILPKQRESPLAISVALCCKFKLSAFNSPLPA